MRIQRPTITQITELKGDGASLTGSFSGSFIGWDGIDGKPDNIISSSTQLSVVSNVATTISGSFTATSASIAADIAGLDGNYATDAELLAATASLSASLAVDIIANENNITLLDGEVTSLMAFTGSFSQSIAGRVTTEEINVDLLQAHQTNLLGSTGSRDSHIANIHVFTGSQSTLSSGINTYTASLKSAFNVSGADTTFEGSIYVQGTGSFGTIQSVTGSAKLIGDAYIVVNNDTPVERYAGLAVYDSGSNTTASLNFDGQTNDWFYEYNDGAIDYGAVLFGPEYSTKGTPTYPTSNKVQKGAGTHHLADSTITDTGTQITLGSNTTLGTNTLTVGDSKLILNATTVTSTGAELNLVDGSSAGTVVNSKAVIYGAAGEVNATTLQIGGVSLDNDLATLSLPASTTITTFGASLVDDANAAAARTTLGLGTVATLNSIDISTNTNLAVSDTTGQTGINLTLTGDSISGVVSGLGTANDVQFDSLGIGTAAPGTTGVIRATNDIVAYYSSDERLKDNITPLHGALDKVKLMGGYEFDWNSNQEVHEGHDIGVVAQEVQAQYPELVHERDNGYLAVDYVKLTAVLLQAVKELSAKVDELSK